MTAATMRGAGNERTERMDASETKATKPKGFFAVDYRAARRAAELGPGPGCAYLVLAMHTGRDNRSTTAGVTAIATHLGLSRGRATRAYEALERADLFRRTGGRSAIQLATWDEMNAPKLTARQREVLARVKGGEPIVSGRDRDHGTANGLVQKGVLRRTEGDEREETGWFAVRRDPPEWAWLPNTFVTGFDGVPGPALRLRAVQDWRIVALALDCYRQTNLAENGGLHWRVIREEYSREKVGQQGRHTVWGVARKTMMTWWDRFGSIYHTHEYDDDGRDLGGEAFWSAWSALQHAGVIEMVPHLIEADTEDAMPIHAYAIGDQTGEPIERDVREAAHDAGLRMVQGWQYERAAEKLERLPWLCPVPSHLTNVQLVGIARLVHRPHTKRTAAWAANLLHNAPDYVATYRSLAQTPMKAAA